MSLPLPLGVAFFAVVSAVTLLIASAVAPPATDECENLKVVRGVTGCVKFSPDLEYYMLFNKMDPANPPNDGMFSFTLLVKKPNLLAGKWLGLGIGLSGGMKGADFLMLTKDASSSLWVASDRYSDDYGRPFADKSQDYEISSQSESATQLELNVKRKLDTCDYFDVRLNPHEANFCLWAHGSAAANGGEETTATTASSNIPPPTASPPPTRHAMHSSNARGATMCDFWVRASKPSYGSTTDYPIRAHHGKDPHEKAYVYTDHLVKSVSVENQYVTAFLSTRQIFGSNNTADADPLHPVRWITKIEPLIDNAALLHHIVLYSCPTLTHDTMPDTVYDVLMVETCDRLIMAWAVGGNGISFPSDVAFKLGERESVIALNMHYYNPNMLQNQRDASGFTFTALPVGQTTKYESDIWLFGDLFYQGLPNSKLHPDYHFSHFCPATCVEDMVEAKELTVLQLGYHGHFDTKRSEAGLIKRQNSVFDPDQQLAVGGGSSAGGTTTSFTAALQPGPLYLYDYNHQRTVESDLKIRRGSDGSYVRCTWDFSKRHYLMSYGDGSNDEMCFALWQYYPRQPGLGHGTCAFSLEDRTWIGEYRTAAGSYCSDFCERDVIRGYYVKKGSASTDLFEAQTVPFAQYGGRMETRAKATLVSEMTAACGSCSTTQRLWATEVPCESCAALNITSDCDVLVYRGWCPEEVAPTKIAIDGSNSANPAYAATNSAAQNTAIAAFAANYYKNEEAKLCSHYCAIGSEGKSLWSCLRSGRYTYAGGKLEHFPVRLRTSNFTDDPLSTSAAGATTSATMNSNDQCPAALPRSAFVTSAVPPTATPLVSSLPDGCAAHGDCLSYEYCADTKTWHPEDREWTNVTASSSSGLENGGFGLVANRKFCRSCSHCCQRVDAFDNACPGHCGCDHPNVRSCFKKGPMYMFCSGCGSADAGAPTSTSHANSNACVELPSETLLALGIDLNQPSMTANETALVGAAECPSLCPTTTIPTDSWAHYDSGSRTCEVCQDFGEIYEKRMTNYMDRFVTGEVANLLKPYSCEKAPQMLSIIQPLNPFVHATMEEHAKELCRWTLRESVCRRQEGGGGNAGNVLGGEAGESSGALGVGGHGKATAVGIFLMLIQGWLYRRTIWVISRVWPSMIVQADAHEWFEGVGVLHLQHEHSLSHTNANHDLK
eukprot:g10419.t1